MDDMKGEDHCTFSYDESREIIMGEESGKKKQDVPTNSLLSLALGNCLSVL